MIDLSDYAPLSERVAALDLDADVVFTPDLFPAALPDRQPLNTLVLRGPGRRFSSRADLPELPFEPLDMALSHDWFAERETYRRVGLWLLHLLFSGKSFAGLDLRHAESRLKTLWVFLDRNEDANRGLLKADREITFRQYDHYRMAVIRHPFCDPPMGDACRIGELDRPAFRFGWSDPAERYGGHADKADEMIVSLSPEGLCAMASLLMDLSAPENDVTEVNLESPFLGYAATQPLSVEARLWLPGSFGFYAETLDQMCFDSMS